MKSFQAGEKKGASLAKYILQTLVTVIPLSTIAGALMSYFVIKLSGRQLWVSVGCFLIAGLLLGIFASFKNYRKFIKPLNEIGNLAKSLECSDITYLIDTKNAGGQAELIQCLNGSVANLRSTIKETIDVGASVSAAPVEMRKAIRTLNTISEQVAEAISELARGAVEQAGSMEGVTSSIKDIVNGLSKINLDMEQTEHLAGNALTTVGNGEKSVHFQEMKMKESKLFVSRVSSAVSTLADKSKEIGDILTAINGIAEQTNMLSLNAAIEAARAGEQGKGFAVVANEVRKLAEQSADSVHKIEKLITEVQLDINNAVQEMDKVEAVVAEQEKAMFETIGSFEGIHEAVSAITGNVKAVYEESSSITRNTRAAEAVIGKVANIIDGAAAATEEVSASTQEQTSVVQSILAEAEKLSELAEKLKGNISHFIV